MGGLSRSKGQRGEREVAALLSELTGHDVRRRVRNHAGDSDLQGLPGWDVEVKFYAAVTPGLVRTWWTQAVEQSRITNTLPVLFYRASRGDWRVVWPAGLHITPRPGPLPPDYLDTLTGDPLTWWRMVRGLPK